MPPGKMRGARSSQLRRGRSGFRGRPRSDASTSSFQFSKERNRQSSSSTYPRKRMRASDEIISSDEEEELELSTANGMQSNDPLAAAFSYSAKSQLQSDDENNEDTDYSIMEGLAPEARRIHLAKRYLTQAGISLNSKRDETEKGEGDENDTSFSLTPGDPDSLNYLSSPLDRLLPTSSSTLREVTRFTLNTLGNFFYRGHRAPVTCIAIQPQTRASQLSQITSSLDQWNGQEMHGNLAQSYNPPLKAFTGGKDGAILMWDIPTGTRSVFTQYPQKLKSGKYAKQVLDLCMSHDDPNILCSAGEDQLVKIWDIRLVGKSSANVAQLKGHKNAITSICAEPSSELQQIFTASLDNTVKVWSLKTQSYINSLYGHVSGVLRMDILSNNRPLTVSEDGTARLWKVREETHFVFKHPVMPLDSCSILNSVHFATGSQDGSITLWNVSSRKPLYKCCRAHNGHWITAMAAVRNSNLLFSGSDDGFIRLWRMSYVKAEKGKASLTELAGEKIPIDGVVNALSVSGSMSGSSYKGIIFAAIGKEHRLGRWVCMSNDQSRNGICIIPFSCSFE
ncbi:WD domain, G-beta repeat-containing protein [Cardiosporidium cionae]|uniref:WD domain, G-beta repeat-containing protein n=1 Tax=Cardiosporidium cionae TaxID=476202 RepID=A0ABQ7J6D4_9APIC|nr:WD domain, G-beta repeat-containing protein [Cardiosporidium cionae]|eukprot:KAF8819559.1 WD domain, G-beta repeat-containing protein [Cardiosporidium cionae]